MYFVIARLLILINYFSKPIVLLGVLLVIPCQDQVQYHKVRDFNSCFPAIGHWLSSPVFKNVFQQLTNSMCKFKSQIVFVLARLVLACCKKLTSRDKDSDKNTYKNLMIIVIHFNTKDHGLLICLNIQPITDYLIIKEKSDKWKIALLGVRLHTSLTILAFDIRHQGQGFNISCNN